MATEQSILFSWADKLPDLRRLALVLETLPDEALLTRLEERRGRGRDDYPVRVARDYRRASARTVAGPGTQRNPALLELCGFSPPRRQRRQAVYDVSGTPQHGPREPQLLSGQPPWSREPDGFGSCGSKAGRTGEHLGYDGKAVDSYSTGQTSRKTGKTPDADWGKHETTGVDRKTGNLWRKVKSWFGYGCT